MGHMEGFYLCDSIVLVGRAGTCMIIGLVYCRKIKAIGGNRPCLFGDELLRWRWVYAKYMRTMERR